VSFNHAMTFALLCAGGFFVVASVCEVVKTFWHKD